MNWNIEYIPDGKFVKVDMKGNFHPEEVEVMADEMFAQPFWRPGINVLLDHLELDFGVTDVETWRGLSELHVRNNAKFGETKLALLMKSLPDYARGRQYELLAEPKVSARIRVFQNEAEAVEWLRN